MRATARLVGINLGVFAAGLLLIEAVFGDWIFGPHLGYLSIARDVVYRHDVSRVDPRRDVIAYTRDRYGLRGDYGGEPSKIDVLVMGGSTTAEGYVDDTDSWVAVLDRKLAAAGYGLKAVNAGIPGHSSIAHIRSFDVWLPLIPGLRPKYVMFYIGINDTHAEALERYDLLERRRFWGRVGAMFRNNSALYNAYRVIRGTWRARRVNIVHKVLDTSEARMTRRDGGGPERTARLAAAWRDRLDAYEGRVRKLVELVRGRGAEPILVTQLRGDSRWRGDSVIAPSDDLIDWAFIQRLFNDVTLRVCREAQGVCIDLERRFVAEDGDFFDDVHTTTQGSAKVAAIVFDGLRAALPAPSEPRETVTRTR